MDLTLSKLVFEVNTSQLKEARDEIGKLAKAVQDLNSAQTKADKESSNTAKEKKKADQEAAKALKEKTAAEKEQAKAAKESEDSQKRQLALLEKLDNIYRDMANGMTRGEASILNQARAFGIAEDMLMPYKKALEQIRELSKSPFDASLGALRNITEQFQALQDRVDLAKQSIYLTKQQLSEYSRIAAESRGKVVSAGLDIGSAEGQALYNKLVSDGQAEYIKLAKAINIATEEEKQRQALLLEAQARSAAGITMMDQEVAKFKELQQKRLAAGSTMMDQEVAKYKEAQSKKAAADAEAQSVTARTYMDAAVQLYHKDVEAKRKASEAKIALEARAMDQEVANYKEMQRKKFILESTVMDHAVAKYKESQAKKEQSIKLNIEAERVRLLEEAAKANAYLNRESEKLVFTNEQLARGFTSASANALFKYKEALIATGASANEAKQSLYMMEQELYKKQGTSPFAKLQKDMDGLNTGVNHLARNIATQYSDIFTSLYNGQGIMQVMTQQLPQIADAFTLAGVSGKNATAQLTAGFGAAFAGYKMLFGAVLDLANNGFKSLINATEVLTGVNKRHLEIEKQLTDTTLSKDRLTRLGTASQLMYAKALGVAGIAVASLAALTVGTLAVAYFQVTEENQKLTNQLILNGASMGLSSESAIKLAESMNQVGLSSGKSKEILGLMAAQGGFTSKQFEDLSGTINKFAKYSGASLEDVIKKFSGVNKDPVKALSELQIATGQVSTEVQKNVNDLIQQGDRLGANTEALKEYKRVIDISAEALKGAMPWYKELWNILDHMGQISWDTIKGGISALFGAPPKEEQIRRLEKLLEVARAAPDVGTMQSDEVVKRLEQRLKVLKETKGLSAEEASANAKAEEDRRKAEDYTNKLKFENSKLDAKKVTQQQYVNGMVEREIKANSFLKGNKEAILALEEKYNDEYKKANEARNKSEATKAQNAINQALSTYNSILDVADGETKNYTKQVEALDLIEKKHLKTTEEIAKARELLNQQQPWYKAQRAAEISAGEARNKLVETFVKEQEAQVEALALAEKEGALLEYKFSILGLSSDTQAILLAQKQEELNLEKEITKIKKLGLTKSQEDALIADATTVSAKKQLNIIADDTIKTFEKVSSSLSDIVATAIFEGGEAGLDKLENYLNTTFKKFVIDVIINPVVNDVLSSTAQALGINVPGVTSGGSGSFGSSLSTAATGYKAISSAMESGIVKSFDKLASTSVGQSLGFTQGSTADFITGAKLQANGAGVYAQEAGGATASGANAMASAKQIGIQMAAAFAGQWARKKISGGYSIGKDGEKIMDIAAVIAGFEPTGIASLVTGAVSGLINRAFGKKLTEVGIMGTFGGQQGFQGSQYQQYKGGWFSSNKTKTSALDQETTNTLANSYRAIQISTAALATNIGLSADAVMSYSKDIKLNLKDLSPEDQTKKVTEVFTQIQEDMAKAVLDAWGDWSLISKYGQTASEVLQNVSQNLAAVNSAFDLLNIGLITTSMQGAVTAMHLTELFGDSSGFSSAISSYYDNFFTAEEKVKNLTDMLTETFASLGLALPRSNKEFRSIVESLDLNTDSGQQAFVSIMKVQGAFTELVNSSTSASESVSSLLEEINRLKGVNQTQSSNTSGLQGEFANLTQLVRSGDVSAVANLLGVSQSIEADMQNFAASASDVVFARAWLAQSLQDTMSVLNGTKSISDVAGTTGTISTFTASASTAGTTALTSSGSSQAELIASLIVEVQMLRAEVRADVDANSKTSRILDRAMQDGESLNVTVLA
jgi:phage-related minor tail protein